MIVSIIHKAFHAAQCKGQIYSPFEENSKGSYDNIITNCKENLTKSIPPKETAQVNACVFWPEEATHFEMHVAATELHIAEFQQDLL